ncbi:N-acetyltransferase [Mucilaginibacter sp. L3T2-6]|uniref:GNAT family N-acetyltransferase n=1 Tax=Mucilaginibacter sp. L3T2-6 TaxID=3062491 RepID=UPI002675EEC3|nr:GNAT family N-acetyltransferase [Mucilaginibacter sp. L3T2-6]MDO3644003.1 GNAT family N-acetyltransferase [Mucilaginibacter sp. L3T2-6]MDV6216454.1 GNAT family N-acetyltransferase [Mucilaginibacter sp. L3T2-6]
MDNIQIVPVQISDADSLLQLSLSTFLDFFGPPVNEQKNIDAYTSIAFTPEKILSELMNPDSRFYFARDGEEIAGYIKLNFNAAQNEFKDPQALEIERIYVSRAHHKKQIGSQLINFAINTALNKKMDYIWLGVWEHNHRAISFYERNGFRLVGRHNFMLGDDVQTDLLMRRELYP